MFFNDLMSRPKQSHTLPAQREQAVTWLPGEVCVMEEGIA